MTEKELVKNLAALQSVTPNRDWVSRNREVLSYQIFNGSEYAETKLGFFESLSLISKRLLQPTPIAALIAVCLMVGGVFASNNSMPDSPLYIAKTLSERVQLTATFNETAKARLNLEFASQRAAEMEKLSANEAIGNNKLESVSANFKKEIESARARISKIKPAAPVVTEVEPEEVISAGTEKDDKGIQIEVQSAEQGLKEAEQLFNEKDYDGAASKLEELGRNLK